MTNDRLKELEFELGEAVAAGCYNLIPKLEKQIAELRKGNPGPEPDRLKRQYCTAKLRIIDGERTIVIQERGIAGEITLAPGVMPSAKINGETMRIFFQTIVLESPDVETTEWIGR